MSKRPFSAVVIGASAGAIESLSRILPVLPATFPLPIIIVVHVPADRKSMMDELFRERCAVKVKEAEDKELLSPGTVYFAAPDYHLLVEKDRRLSLSSEEPVLHSRPSIDVLFETAADAFGPELIGVILSGANEDGSKGLRTAINAGALGFVQSPETSYATAMPTAALRLCPEAQALGLDKIASCLQELG